MSIAAIAGIHMEGPYLSPDDGARGAHPREHVQLGEPRRLRAPAGRRRRPDRARHARARSCRARFRSSSTSSRRASASRSGIPRRRRNRSPMPRRQARRWPRIWATAARRCCRVIPTSSGSCWPPTRSGQPHRRWPPPAAVDGEGDGPGEGSGPDDPRHRRDRRRRKRARDRYTIGGVECELGDGRSRVAAGHAVSRGIDPDAGSRHRQHRAVHRPADRDRDSDGVDDSRELSRHDDCRTRSTADWDRGKAGELQIRAA